MGEGGRDVGGSGARTAECPFRAAKREGGPSSGGTYGDTVSWQIRIHRGSPGGEVVRVTLHDDDGDVPFEGHVG